MTPFGHEPDPLPVRPADPDPPVPGEDIPIARIAAERMRRRSLPEPGFLMSIVWCLGLLASLYIPLFAFAVFAFGVQAVISGDPKQFVKEQGDHFRKIADFAEAENKPPGGPPAWSESGSYSLAAGMLAGHLCSLAFTMIVLRYVTGRTWPRLVALRRPAAAHVILALLILPGLMIVHSGAHGLLHWTFDSDPGETEEGLRAMLSPWPIWLGILLFGVGPGIIEELFCRGFLARGLVGRYGYPIGVLMTSAFFGLLHVEPLYAMGTAVMGVFLHITYLLTRSLWVPILLHFGNNSIGVTAMMTADSAPSESAASYVCAAMLTVVGLLAMWTARARLVAVDPDGHPDPSAEPGRPRFPGVELPPPGSGTIVQSQLPHPLLFIIACGLFAGLIYTFL